MILFQIVDFLIGCSNTPFRLDMDQFGGGLLLYVWEDLSPKPLTEYKHDSNIENVFRSRSNERKNGFGLVHTICLEFFENHLNHISKCLHEHFFKCENLFTMEDFKLGKPNVDMEKFCETTV